MSGRHQIGLVGLGPMGENFAKNLLRTGHRVGLHNRTHERAVRIAAEDAREFATAAESARALAALLERPRKIVVLVDPGATGAVIDDLRPWLEPGDVIVDGGNADFADTTVRQAVLASDGIHLLGAGINSGVDGALEGISATTGGDCTAYERVRPFLDAAGVVLDGESCCVRVGDNGSGHFVKMVHNGVEYTLMQLVAEVISVLRAATALSPVQLGDQLDAWNAHLQCYVVQVAVDVLRHEDSGSGLPFVDVIGDRAVQNGSGSWAGQSALALGTPATLFAESSFARAVSADLELRTVVAERYPAMSATIAPDPTFLRAAEETLRAAVLVSYGQALRHIHTADSEHGWNIDLGSVVHSWRGATIRSSLLREIHTACSPDAMALVAGEKFFLDELAATESSWRQVVLFATRFGIPVPCLSSGLSYLDGIRARRSPGAVVQALRSRLGGSSYERTDREGSFRLAWDTDLSEAEA